MTPTSSAPKLRAERDRFGHELKYTKPYTYMARAVILLSVDRQPFRFAVQATNASGARDWREFTCKVEDLGYSCLMLADHYLGPGPAQQAARTPRQDLAPIAAIAAAAAYTTVLRVGCRVFCIDYHVPAVLAKEAATLDLLSDGRLELGIGAGWSGVEYEAMGLTFDTPGRRIAKLEEVVALIKAHCSGEELACAGEFVNVDGYQGTPQPVQRPHPPIMIGGGGKRVLTYAGREADIVSINTVPFVVAQRRRPDSTGGGARAGSNTSGPAPGPASATSTSRVRRTSSNVDSADDAETRCDAHGREDGDVARRARRPPERPRRLRGRDRRGLQARREMLGVNYVTVQQKQAERFAPIVARLTGT